MNKQWVGWEGWHVKDTTLDGVDITGYPIGVLVQEAPNVFFKQPVKYDNVQQPFMVAPTKEIRI